MGIEGTQKGCRQRSMMSFYSTNEMYKILRRLKLQGQNLPKVPASTTQRKESCLGDTKTKRHKIKRKIDY